MSDPLLGMSPHDLIARALEEDHAADWAGSPEAAIAHRELAQLMRRRAEDMLDRGINDAEQVRPG